MPIRPKLPPGHMICGNCGEEKTLNQFHQLGKLRSGNVRYDKLCKICSSSGRSEVRRAIKLQAIGFLGGRCAVCGYDRPFPEVYDFHHMNSDTKEVKVSDVIKDQKRFNQVIKDQLEDCLLLCANCHRRAHSDPSIKNFIKRFEKHESKLESPGID